MDDHPIKAILDYFEFSLEVLTALGWLHVFKPTAELAKNESSE